MKQTDFLECPHCTHTQTEDLYDYLDSPDEEGTFKIRCENCENEFYVQYELKPFVQTKKPFEMFK